MEEQAEVARQEATWSILPAVLLPFILGAAMTLGLSGLLIALLKQLH
jgi:hypothetical protein